MKTKDLGNKEIMSENIKRYLSKKSLNVKEFSEIMGFKYTTVLDWVNAKTYPRIDKIELMSRYFGVDKSDLVEKYSETSSILSEINKISSQLEEPRQKIVLDTASSQLEEQEKAKRAVKPKPKVTPLFDINSPLTDEELQEAVDEAVAFDGVPLTDREKELYKHLLREAWEEDHDRG